MIHDLTIQFKDVYSDDDAMVVVRHDSTAVTLALSLKSDGDIEVSMSKESASRLIEALKVAVSN